MKTLTEVGIAKQAQRFVGSLSHATFEIGGTQTNIDIFKTSIVGDTVKVFIYFDDTVDGEIGNIKLIDKDGDVVAIAERVFNKPRTKGLYVAFKYKFVEMEVEENGGIQ